MTMRAFILEKRIVLQRLLLCVCLLVLVWQAYTPLWRGHLQADITTHRERAASFLQHLSWETIGYNEYQPGALWFFVGVGILTTPPLTFDAFLTAMIIVNSGLLIAHFIFFERHGPTWSPLLFLALVVATGPLLLFRFELLVSLLTLWAWYWFTKKKYFLAAAVLGLAISAKLYPIILIPLLVAEVVRRKQRKALGTMGLGLSIGLLVPIGLFLWFGGSLHGLVESIQFHQLKPIGLEGFWGNMVTVIEKVQDIPVRLASGYGIHGLTSDLPFLTNHFLESAWMIPYGLTIGVILWRWRRVGYSEPGLAFVLIFVFVYFSKVVNPQYLWWFAVMLPAATWQWFSRPGWQVLLGLLVISLVLTQLVYPIRYTEFLEWFNGVRDDATTFYIMVIRNGLLLVAMVMGYFSIKRSPVV